jgi:hypothetical protein
MADKLRQFVDAHERAASVPDWRQARLMRTPSQKVAKLPCRDLKDVCGLVWFEERTRVVWG